MALAGTTIHTGNISQINYIELASDGTTSHEPTILICDEKDECVIKCINTNSCANLHVYCAGSRSTNNCDVTCSNGFECPLTIIGDETLTPSQQPSNKPTGKR